MNWKSKEGESGSRGLVDLELLLLVSVLLLFLVGMVALINGSVNDPDTVEVVNNESDRVYEAIGALLSDSRSVSLEQRSLEPTFNRTRLVFKADLDGTGGHGVPGKSAKDSVPDGFQTVALMQSQKRPTELIAIVWGDSPEARRVVISTDLDPEVAEPIAIKYVATNGKMIDERISAARYVKISSIKVSLSLSAEGEEGDFCREFTLKEPLVSEECLTDPWSL